MKRLPLLSILGLSFTAVAGAGSEPSLALPDDYARQREVQTRQWQAADEGVLLRSVMSAMQDLEFVLEDAEPTLGLAMGTRYVSGRRVRLVVLVRPRGAGRHTVRACAYLYNNYLYHSLLTDPKVYQDFFDALGHTTHAQALGPGR